jgi:dihydroneopterin aldolase
MQGGMSNESGCIHIQELELAARIGVPDDERAQAQRLTASITMWPATGFDQMRDDLNKTIDYAEVVREVQAFVSERSDKLIETLADAIAGHLLHAFALQRVRIELRKFVLPKTKFVAAICERCR